MDSEVLTPVLHARLPHDSVTVAELSMRQNNMVCEIVVACRHGWWGLRLLRVGVCRSRAYVLFLYSLRLCL